MTAQSSSGSTAGAWWKRPWIWLVVMVFAFFAVSLYFGIVAFDNFQTKNSTDAGIITQAVATAWHGQPAPFYESYDCMDKLRCSFLLVHPGFVLYGAVPFFALYPSTVTLFALRSALVALAAVPLYWLTRQVTRSPGKALVAAGLFLVWAPLLAGDVFSLHLESLLPLELFSLAALWQAKKYRLGLIVAGASFLTFEVYPVFTFLVGLFFLSPYIGTAIREHWVRWRSRTKGTSSLKRTLSSWVSTIRYGIRLREVRYTLVLMGASLAAFVILETFINVWGFEVLGVVAPASHPGISGIFYDPSTPPPQPLSSIVTATQTLTTAEYWFILYALVGFLPLLSPRSLILSVPWIGYTFLTVSPRYTTLGSQYTMIAAAPIFIGLAYALVRLPIGSGDSRPGLPTPSQADPPDHRRWRTRQRRGVPVRAIVLGVVGVVVVANVLFLPIDPALPYLGVKTPPPFEPGYFDRDLSPNPAIAYAVDLASLVPYGAIVLAPSPYFPLVASDPYAYVFNTDHENTSRLPFNVSEGPEYLLLEPSWIPKLWPSLQNNLSNPDIYGMRGYVSYTTGGPLLLYEEGWTAPAQLFGPSLSPTNSTYTPQDGILPGPLGRLANDSSSPTGWVVENTPGGNRTGEVWSVPISLASPGNYTLQVEVELVSFSGKGPADSPVLRISAKGVGANLVNTTFSASDFSPGSWTNLTFNVTLGNPLADLDIGGYLQDPHAGIAVSSVSLLPRL